MIYRSPLFHLPLIILTHWLISEQLQQLNDMPFETFAFLKLGMVAEFSDSLWYPPLKK